MMPSAPVTFLKTCSEDQMRWCVGGGRAVEQTFHNFIRNSKTLRSLSNLEAVEGVTVPDAQLQYKAIAIQTAWCGHRNRHRDQPSRTEKPDTDLRPYAQLIADKGGQSDGAGKTVSSHVVRGRRRGLGWSTSSTSAGLGARVPVGTPAQGAGWIPGRSTYKRQLMFLSLAHLSKLFLPRGLNQIIAKQNEEAVLTRGTH